MYSRTLDQRRRDEVVRSINKLVHAVDTENSELIPDEIKDAFMKLKAKYPNGVSVVRDESFGYLFVGGKLSKGGED